jgi:DUF971 family protein
VAIGVVCLLAALAGYSAGAAQAATVSVNCAPFGSDNLQTKINAASPGDVLSIKGTCTGNFTISKNLTLQGSPSATLNGGGGGQTVMIPSGKTVALTNLTVTGGHAMGMGATGSGGGIFSLQATLTLTNCLVTGNTADGAGGGIVSGTMGMTQAGSLTLHSTSVTNNVAVNGGAGGILNHNGTAVIVDSQISGNTAPGGGGIANGNGNGGGGGGTMTITDSTISSNVANGGPTGGAGGIANGGSLTLSGSLVSRNQAVGGTGGGIFNHGTATITGSQISSNYAPDDSLGDQGAGGGIANLGFSVAGSGDLTISNSLITMNQAGAGGGIATGDAGGDASTTVTGTTISLNSVKGPQSIGGGIGQIASTDTASLTVSGSTLVGNQARQGLGGAIGSISVGGTASVSVDSTAIGSTRVSPPYSLNPNQAEFGAGIFNGALGGPAGVSLSATDAIVGNQASISGGGVFNADGAGFSQNGAIVLLNRPNNVDNDPGF